MPFFLVLEKIFKKNLYMDVRQIDYVRMTKSKGSSKVGIIYYFVAATGLYFLGTRYINVIFVELILLKYIYIEI